MCGRQHSQKWGKLPKGKHRIFQRTETQRCFLQKIAHNLKHFDDLSLRFGYPPPFYACTALLLSIPQETLSVHNLVCCKNNQNLRIKPEPLYSWSRCNCICPVFVYKLSTVHCSVYTLYTRIWHNNQTYNPQNCPNWDRIGFDAEIYRIFGTVHTSGWNPGSLTFRELGFCHCSEI